MQNQIPKNWRDITLGEIIRITRGASPRPIQDYLSSKGMPWVKIADATVSDSRFIEKTKECIRMEGVKNSVTVDKGELIVSNSATPGIPKFMKIKACVHDGWLIFRDFKGILPNYTYYYMLWVRKNLVSKTTGSVFDNLKTDIVKQFPIKFPPENIQYKIASTLSSFDDKIEVNNKIAKTLEKMAQAIFKEWIIKNKNDFVIKELGKVSINYDRKRKPLSDMQRSDIKGIYPYHGATEAMDYINEYIFDGEYLLVAEDGTVETADGKPVLQFIEGKFWVNNHAHIIQGIEGVPTFYLYLTLKNTHIKPFITGAVQLKLTQENLNKIPTVIPSKQMMDKFTKIVYPMIIKIRKCKHENQKLATLRDLLLPKLMKGEIRV